MKACWRVALAATVVLAGYATSTVVAASAPASSAPTCTENTSRQVVLSFIDAFNNGDAARLAKLLADYARYGTDAPSAFSSPTPVNRSELIAYFLQRHQAHERLQLESLQFNSRSANDYPFVFEVTRSADGLAPTPFGGKGAVFCGNPSNGLILWAMGREPFLRARLPLYGSVALLFLVLGVAAALIAWRRAHLPKMKVAARPVRGEWIDG